MTSIPGHQDILWQLKLVLLCELGFILSLKRVVCFPVAYSSPLQITLGPYWALQL